MKKIHTRMKRKFGLASHHKHYHFFHPTEKPHRPQTYSTEESAKAAAEKLGIKKYSLKKVKCNKRFQIVPAV